MIYIINEAGDGNLRKINLQLDEFYAKVAALIEERSGEDRPDWNTEEGRADIEDFLFSQAISVWIEDNVPQITVEQMLYDDIPVIEIQN